MLSRLLRRNYASKSDSESLMALMARSDCRKVLSLSQSRITSKVQAELRQYRTSGLSKKIRVNNFLKALFTDDLTNTIGCVQTLRSQALRYPEDADYGQIYITCLQSLVTYLAKNYNNEIRSRDLNKVSSSILEMPESIVKCYTNQVEQIKGLTLIVMLNSLRKTKQAHKMKYIGLATQARILAKKLDYNPTKLYDLAGKFQINIAEQIKEVFSVNETVNFDKEKASLSLERYRSANGSMSFEALCRFIQEECFQPKNWSQSTSFKLYKIYEDLNEKDKGKFMKEYMKFNREKQLLIESQCLNLFKSTSVRNQVHGFKNVHKKWMSKWNTSLTDAIESLLLCNRRMQKFSFIVKYIGSDVLASMVLAYMLSSTIPVTHVKVLELCKRLSFGLKIELRKSYTSSSSLADHLQDEDLLQFVGEIIKMAVENCKLPEYFHVFEKHLGDDPFGGNLFIHEYAKDVGRQSKFKYYGIIRVHSLISESFKSYKDLLRAGSFFLPMIHPPKKWTSPTEGGFLSFPIPLVKSNEPESFKVIMDMAHKTGQLKSIYQSLNDMGTTSWAVNPFTLNAFKHALANKDLRKLAIPSAMKVEIAMDLLNKEYADLLSESLTPRFKLKQKKACIDQQKKDQVNLNSYYELILALAESFSKNGEVLYLPHNLDFRGRVYPSVSFLSHHSEDLVRSLLMFWEAKELGPSGFDWLMYQLSNLYNTKKLGMQELKEFVLEHKDEIIESAENPFAGKMWWASGECPWQSLAVCKEIRSVWSYQGDVTTYKSRIPIHQDGTCNGLQHYAALSADKKAAESVNVQPAEQRQDVYTSVLSLVKRRVLRDLKMGKDADLAQLAYCILDRKLIKQTVMTTVYGVTLFGATKQIKNQVDGIIVGNQNDLRSETLKKNSLKLSSYVAQHILLSINELFSGAKQIQCWLVDNCSRCIQAFQLPSASLSIDFFSKNHYQPFMWTSLSGFPVVQYYRKNSKRNIPSALQSITINHPTKVSPIDVRKQKNGIAPNFIHSIDAIHLLMTCLTAQIEGITFAAVHDCFWTHPSDVKKLSSIIREEFIRLHKSGIMENLRNDLLHINRSNFQLVWVSKEVDEEFCREISTLRKQYTNHGGSTLTQWNVALNIEIMKPARVQALIESHQPELLFSPKALDSVIFYDSTPVVKEKISKISRQTHIPVLVPVKILDLPEKGTLNLDSVKDSIHFFS